MVSAHLVDAIRDPSHVILGLYEGNRRTDVDFPAQVTSHFATVFHKQDSIEQIPPLSINYPPDAHSDRSLVRFHAMVQDTRSPEMYLSRLPGGKCGGWCLYEDLATPSSVDMNFRDLRECSVFWAITVPGESQWYTERLEGTLFNEDHICPPPPTAPSCPKLNAVPRMSLRAPYLTSLRHKFPNPQSADFGVLLKIYDEGLTKTLKPMDTATFVGILVWDSIETETGVQAAVLPVLHVTYIQVSPPEIPSESSRDTITTIYESLVTWVSQEALGGDRDAAELIILCSVARVQSRNPPILPPSLQLTNFPSPINGSSTPAIYFTLSKVLPLVSILKLSLEALNNDRFVPGSNGEDLSSGYLQIPAGSVILLTETEIKEGEINEKGVRSLEDVQNAMSNQSLRYVFPFSQFSFNTDIGFLLLVEGRQSPFFATDISLPFRPQNGDITQLYKHEPEVKMPEHGHVDVFRNFLSGARQREKLRVPKQLAELIEHDFVEERKRDKSVTQHDLAMKITIARLLGQVLQADELSVELWERAKGLEARRKKRL